ncbi:MAG: DNA primase [Candidatus Izemoplasmatales bacterium]|nr:DNA primase [Candidatus Izemoplasmatales bacterium]
MERISQQTIDEILNAADIVDIVGEYVQLHPAGKNFKGLCPFHNEKTPSFFVSPEKHIFNCFGCGEKGNALAFLQKYKNLSFVEALKILADKYHIPLAMDFKNDTDDKTKRLYEITEAALGYYTLSLTNLASGKPALEYLLARGLDIHTIQYFELGFAPSDFDSLYQVLKPKYQELDLLELGLIKKTTDGSYYDLFRNRIIFPIRNEFGKVVGYSGRLYEEKKDEPKYINSPFTSIFTKGDVLYNLDRAQAAIKSKKRIILYEGFMDVIASVKAGLKEAVASMGTALTSEQARLIKKYTNRVILCYDGDQAGFEAMGKAVPILEKADLEVSLLVLPEELDPDEYTKKYSFFQYAAFVEANQIDKYEFRYRYMKKHTDFTKAAEIERFKIAMFTYLLREASGTVTEIYLAHLAHDALVSLETVQADFTSFQISQSLSRQMADKRVKIANVVMLNKYYKAELILISYYLHCREYREIIHNTITPMFCEDALNSQIMICIDELVLSAADIDIVTIIPTKFSEKQDQVRLVLSYKTGEYSVQELNECIDTIKIRNIRNIIHDLKKQQTLVNQNTDMPEYLRIQNEIIAQKQKEELINGKSRNHQKTD